MNNTHTVLAPQLGEGGKEIKIQRILKEVGDYVLEDENIIEVETDKATLEISSPTEGVINEILCYPSQMVPVGNALLKLGPGKKLETANDTFGQKRRGQDIVTKPNEGNSRVINLPLSQRVLAKQMRLSQEKMILAQIETQIEWHDIDEIKKHYSVLGLVKRPSSTEIILWALSKSMFEFAKFRGRLLDDCSTVEISEICEIGIANSAGEDQILTSVVSLENDSSLSDIQSKIKENANSHAQSITRYHSISVSNMSALGVLSGTPVVVYPALATLFIGAPYVGISRQGSPLRYSNLVLAFDHQVINGAYAAQFLKRIKKDIKNLSVTVGEK